MIASPSLLVFKRRTLHLGFVKRKSLVHLLLWVLEVNLERILVEGLLARDLSPFVSVGVDVLLVLLGGSLGGRVVEVVEKPTILLSFLGLISAGFGALLEEVVQLVLVLNQQVGAAVALEVKSLVSFMLKALGLRDWGLLSLLLNGVEDDVLVDQRHYSSEDIFADLESGPKFDELLIY